MPKHELTPYFDARTRLPVYCRPMDHPMSFCSMGCMACGFIVTGRDVISVEAAMAEHRIYALQEQRHS